MLDIKKLCIGGRWKNEEIHSDARKQIIMRRGVFIFHYLGFI
jgi:hypothetical protein